MESWLEWARGPVFIFAFSFMVLGLVRHVALTVWEIVRSHAAGRGQEPQLQALIIDTLKWLVPVTKVKEQVLFSLTSLVFHVAVILVPALPRRAHRSLDTGLWASPGRRCPTALADRADHRRRGHGRGPGGPARRAGTPAGRCPGSRTTPCR